MDDIRREKLKKRVKLLLGVGFLVSLAIIGIFYGPQLWGFLSNPDRIEARVEEAGSWGPLVFILIQMLQVIVAPLPGQFTGFAAGYLFGSILGSLYSLVGSVIGFTIVFLIARKLGRPLVELFFDKKKLQKFDYLVETKGIFVFFLIFLLPFFPDDLICYMAGLTKTPIRSLIIVATLGRLPSTLLFAFAGKEVAAHNFWQAVWIGLGSLLLAAVLWFRRGQLERLVKRLSEPKSLVKRKP